MDKVFVIKDEQGNFVDRMGLGIINGEWYYSRSTGLTSGLIFYTNPERAESLKNNFQAISDRYNFGKTFSIELMSDSDIPKGKTVFSKIFPVMHYIIKDSLNCFGGSLGLSVKNMDGSGIEWTYVANRNVCSWHNNKNLALAEIQRLEELNEIAHIPYLSWELVCADRADFPYIEREDKLPSLMILNKDIPKGYIGKHKKAEREIRRKYKTIFAEIERDYRGKRELKKKQLAVG